MCRSAPPQTASRPRRRRPSGTDVERLPIRVRIPAETRVSEAASPPRDCVACLAMLVEDTTAFIEQLEVPKDRKRTEKQRRRVAQAELEVLEAVRDVRVAAEALQQMERTFARAVESSSVSTRRRLLRGRGARSLEREIETVRAHLEAKRDQLPAKQKRLLRIEQRARERDAARRSARMFRLHSARHHLDCSAPLFARLMASQLELPVLVTRKDGWRWWWYRDRFWWDDEGLMATDVANIVLQTGPGPKATVRCGRPSACGPPRRGRRASPGGARLRVGKTRSLASGSGPLRRLWLLRKRRVRPHSPDLAGRLRHGSERRAALPIVPRPVGPQRDAHESHARANRCSPLLSTRARVRLRGAFATPPRKNCRAACHSSRSGFSV